MLGLDPIVARGEMAQINDRTNAAGQHAYDLDHRLFSSVREQKEAEKDFGGMQAKAKSHEDWAAKRIRELQDYAQQEQAAGRPVPHTAFKAPPANSDEAIARAVAEVQRKQDALPRQIAEVKQRARMFGNFLKDFDDLQRIDIRKFKRTEEETDGKRGKVPI